MTDRYCYGTVCVPEHLRKTSMIGHLHGHHGKFLGNGKCVWFWSDKETGTRTYHSVYLDWIKYDVR